MFFPLALAAGIAGVSLWPLHFWGAFLNYPGQIHARIMAYGFFGGFIFGFLGTAMPRMLSANPLTRVEVAGLVLSYLSMLAAFLTGEVALGDGLMVLSLLGFLGCMGFRARQRKDTPPPGFVLVGLSALSVMGGASLAVLENYREIDLFWVNLQRLLSYQGFVLLPILGIGPFILPRFFGMQSAHDFPEMLAPNANWKTKAIRALAVGSIIIGSFVLEAAGWFRAAYGIRALAAGLYIYFEVPLTRGPKAKNALGLSIRIAFLSLVAGFVAVCAFPAYRVALLHLTLVGGFAVITFIVATRVVFGHSGNIERLKGRNRWLLLSVGLMLFAMVTRISGDFWPKIMASHYIYGAIVWIISASLWGAYVLPKILRAEAE